jgi:hypothetical protein
MFAKSKIKPTSGSYFGPTGFGKGVQYSCSTGSGSHDYLKVTLPSIPFTTYHNSPIKPE